MKNKRCCVLNTYVKNRSKRYCLPCVEKTLKVALKKINWEGVAHEMARYQRDYLEDDHRGGWYDGYSENTVYWDKMEKVVRKISGSNEDDEIYNTLFDKASEMYYALDGKAMGRIKIVVK